MSGCGWPVLLATLSLTAAMDLPTRGAGGRTDGQWPRAGRPQAGHGPASGRDGTSHERQVGPDRRVVNAKSLLSHPVLPHAFDEATFGSDNLLGERGGGGLWNASTPPPPHDPPPR